MKKILIVYFSRAGENYGVKETNIGNTRILAGYIKDITFGDEFEIVPEIKYPFSYDECCEIANKEFENKIYPNYTEDIDLSWYDIIFIGYPIWWGTYPMIVKHFLNAHDFQGKVVLPFSTNEGSNLGHSIEDLHQDTKATIKDAFYVRGHEVKMAKEKLEKWIGENL